MTPRAILAELLDRLKTQQADALYIGHAELREWPANAIAALTSARLLVSARPTSRLDCPGCERHCRKSVEVYPSEPTRPARAYILCDEPEDMGRIQLDLADLEQWKISGEASPDSFARALGLELPANVTKPQADRQLRRNAAIKAKYEELARAGNRNYVKEIPRTVPGAKSLSDRRIRDIVKGR